MSYGFKVIVEGNMACFTRPEFKVERVSYEIPTPSALEGLLKSVYWKPAIRYVIDKIVVFNPINYIGIRRNEVKEKVTLKNIKSQMKNPEFDPCVYTDECRTQRSTHLLKNVRYGIEFHFELTGIKSEKDENPEKKYYNEILRRFSKGQYFRSPCLGCAEFPVKTIELVEDFDVSEINPEILQLGKVDFGYMLYGLKFKDGGIPLNNDDEWENPLFSDEATAIYYHPYMIDGIIDVKKYREDMLC